MKEYQPKYDLDTGKRFLNHLGISDYKLAKMTSQDIYETVQNNLESKKIDDRDRKVLTLRFGFEGEPIYTLREIGNQFGISRQRTKQIEARALEKLNSSKNKFPKRAYCPPCPVHNHPQFAGFYISVLDIANHFKVSISQVYTLVKNEKFWYSRAIGPIRTTIEDVCYALDDIPLIETDAEEEADFVRMCKNMYEHNLELSPHRREYFERFVEPSLDQTLEFLAKHWLDKRKRMRERTVLTNN